MTNFLPAGIILDELEDIIEYSLRLEQALAEQEVLPETRELTKKIAATAEDILDFLKKFPCQPLIYTGSGTTEEVIARLEWLLALYAMEEGTVVTNRASRRNKKPRKKKAVSGS